MSKMFYYNNLREINLCKHIINNCKIIEKELDLGFCGFKEVVNLISRGEINMEMCTGKDLEISYDDLYVKYNILEKAYDDLSVEYMELKKKEILADAEKSLKWKDKFSKYDFVVQCDGKDIMTFKQQVNDCNNSDLYTCTGE